MARQARALDVLLAEVNAISPKRSKVSDGGLGDPAHASRESDHNANRYGVWRARDFTDDDVDDDHSGGGDDVFDCAAFAKVLVAMYHEEDVHPAMHSGAYTISDDLIYSYDRRDEGWRPYDGSNEHRKHLHQSVATASAGYDSTRPWGIFQEDEVTPEQMKKILDAIPTAAEVADEVLKRAGKGIKVRNARGDTISLEVWAETDLKRSLVEKQS